MRSFIFVGFLACYGCSAPHRTDSLASGGMGQGDGAAAGMPPVESEPEPVPPEIHLVPSNGSTKIELEPTLAFSFSKPMDRESFAAALHFEPRAECAEPTWNDEGTALSCPLSLEPAAMVTVIVDATARGEDGSQLEHAWMSTFTTRERPTLVATSPEDGESVGDLSGSVVLIFEMGNALDEASLEQAFRYVSPAGHEVADANCFFERCTITTSEPFEEGQQVTWELSAQAVDTTGVALGEGVSGSFTIGQRATITLEAIAALDGTVSEAGAVDASGTVLTVGRSGGQASRALLSFDLSQLPADLLAFSKATLTLHHQGTSGSTAALDFLRARSLDYGETLDESAFDAPIHTREKCNLLWQCEHEAIGAGLSPSAGAVWTAPVSALVQRDLGDQAPRSQMRIEFEADTTATVDASETFSSADAAAANRPSLEIEYWAP